VNEKDIANLKIGVFSKDIIQENIPRVFEDTDVKQVSVNLQNPIHLVVAVDPVTDEVKGIITDTDVTKKIAQGTKIEQTTTAKEIMNTEIVKVDANNTVMEVVSIMNKNNLNKVLIVENNKPKGVITRKDMLKKIRDIL